MKVSGGLLLSKTTKEWGHTKSGRNFIEEVLGVKGALVGSEKSRPSQQSLQADGDRTSRLLQSIVDSLEDEAKKKTYNKTRSGAALPIRYRQQFQPTNRAIDVVNFALRKGRDEVEAPLGWRTVPRVPLPFEAVDNNQFDPAVAIPCLEHGLESVLNTSGAIPVFDQDRKCFNFPRTLQSIAQPEEVRFDQMSTFVPASADERLKMTARQAHKGVAFRGSTSSVTKALSLLYHLVSNYRPTSLDGMTKPFVLKQEYFARYAYAPTVLMLHPPNQPGESWAFDPTSGDPEIEEHILTRIGMSLERALTMSEEDFQRNFLKYPETYHATKNTAVSSSETGSEAVVHNYSLIGDMLLRAQIDCHRFQNDRREFFEIKTRAVAPVRYNLNRYEEFLNYKLEQGVGHSRSYALEFYDLVRSAFLSYSLQIRIGRMRGAFICYHNTREIFGFEFISLEEIEKYVYGCSHWAQVSFDCTMKILREVLETARGAFETDADKTKLTIGLAKEGGLHIFVQKCRDGTDKTGPSANLSKVGGIHLKADELKYYHMQIAPYVNGQRVFQSVEVGTDDDFDVAYRIKERPPDLSLYMRNLRVFYGLDVFDPKVLPPQARRRKNTRSYPLPAPKVQSRADAQTKDDTMSKLIGLMDDD